MTIQKTKILKFKKFGLMSKIVMEAPGFTIVYRNLTENVKKCIK